MKNQDSFYAQMRIGFYENRFQNQTIQQLVDNFNQLANSHGWAAERSYVTDWHLVWILANTNLMIN